VGTNSLGINEYMTANNSIIVERNADLICEKIMQLLEDNKSYDNLTQNAITTAKAHDWDDVMPKIEQTYKELI